MARKTKAEAEATRQRILDAAEQVFMAKGVGKASLEEIARTAQVTRGAVYWHFRNKSDVFDAMLERVQLPMTEMVESVTHETTGSLEELKKLCLFALKTLAEDQRHFHVYKILFHHTESDRGLLTQNELAEEAIDNMTRFFENHPHHPGLTPRQAARSLHTQMLGIYYDWLRNPKAYNLGEEAESLIDTIFRGIGPGK
jgi:TetR/AcrR family acrAB operon transcriptional repressor/TetR/AcrR family transcriptional repressor of mexAB-oprM operon